MLHSGLNPEFSLQDFLLSENENSWEYFEVFLRTILMICCCYIAVRLEKYWKLSELNLPQNVWNKFILRQLKSKLKPDLFGKTRALSNRMLCCVFGWNFLVLFYMENRKIIFYVFFCLVLCFVYFVYSRQHLTTIGGRWYFW